MNKYKIEFTQSIKYCIDVFAENEAEADANAREKFAVMEARGTLHYVQTDEETTVGMVYNVTNTDDPFNP